MLPLSLALIIASHAAAVLATPVSPAPSSTERLGRQLIEWNLEISLEQAMDSQVLMGVQHTGTGTDSDSDSEEVHEEGLTAKGWVDPRIFGGRLLDFTTPHKGEPLNVIISGKSDPYILTDSGFSNYVKSLGFSRECLGLHVGNIHQANLGDGNDRQDEQVLARQYYFTTPGGPILGTCWESLAGGNHFRAWKQNGTAADSGAWFLGASKEENSSKNHKIIPNGYNIGRDFFVSQAVSSPTHWNSIWWETEVEEWLEGLLEPGKEGVNHGIEQDGRVALLRVRRL